MKKQKKKIVNILIMVSYNNANFCSVPRQLIAIETCLGYRYMLKTNKSC